MRKITLQQIVIFLGIFGVVIVAAIATTVAVVAPLPLGDFRGVVTLIAWVALVYLYALLAFRLFLRVAPLEPGEIGHGTKQESIYHIYLLFFLLIFYPIMRSGFMPVPLMRLVYLALGARLGDNTYSSGIILDPIFVSMGRNCIVGQYALIIPHVIENEQLAHVPVRIGDNVTIGAHAVVMAGVQIGDNALVATGAVVSKNTVIGSGEIWGGVPARRLKGAEAETAQITVITD